MAAQVVCASSQRELLISNHGPQDLWIGGGGGALRSVCVVNASTSCLAAADTINSTTGACSCGTQQGTLACPARRAMRKLPRSPNVPNRNAAFLHNDKRPDAGVRRPCGYNL